MLAQLAIDSYSLYVLADYGTTPPGRAVSFSNFSCAKILNEKIHVPIGHSSIQLSILLIVE
jgi:hypothetical protein